MSQQKVIFVLYSLRIGGAERQAMILAERLHQHPAYTVEVITLTEGGEAFAFFDDLGISCSYLNLDLWHDNKALRKSKKSLRKAFKRAQADIVLSYTYWPNIISGLAIKRSGVKQFVWGQRDQGINMKQVEVEKKALDAAHFIVSNSNGGQEYLKTHYKLKSSKLKVIPNGIELKPAAKSRAEWRDELGVDKTTTLAVMIANIHFYKDHPTLVKAWTKVVKKLGDAAPTLVLAGHITFPERLEELQALAKEGNIADKIIYPGHVSDVSGIIQACDFAVFSSPAEGLPNGVLEPMAAGLPIVLTDIPGNRDCVGENYPLLSALESSGAFATNVRRLLEDENLFKALAKQNLKRIETHFSGAKLLEAYLKIFNA